MSETAQGIFFLIAVVCFVLAALPLAAWAQVTARVNLVALGLALVAFVWCWVAFAAA